MGPSFVTVAEAIRSFSAAAAAVFDELDEGSLNGALRGIAAIHTELSVLASSAGDEGLDEEEECQAHELMLGAVNLLRELREDESSWGTVNARWRLEFKGTRDAERCLHQLLLVASIYRAEVAIAALREALPRLAHLDRATEAVEALTLASSADFNVPPDWLVAHVDVIVAFLRNTNESVNANLDIEGEDDCDAPLEDGYDGYLDPQDLPRFGAGDATGADDDEEGVGGPYDNFTLGELAQWLYRDVEHFLEAA